MTKLSIDLICDEETGQVVSFEQLSNLSEGCLKTLVGLGELNKMVEAFRITWVKLGEPPNSVPGPRFTVYFRDPLGLKASLTVDYRFIGATRSPHPTADEIFEYFCADTCLPRLIRDHLQSCTERLKKASDSIGKASASSHPLPPLGDNPTCPNCGHVTVRNGTVYKCRNCGESVSKP